MARKKTSPAKKSGSPFKTRRKGPLLENKGRRGPTPISGESRGENIQAGPAAGQKADSPDSAADRFPIAGIGASAGGLEAFEKFFQNMPPEPGIAFILVPHLDPTHSSLMTNLLKKYTSMEVVEIKNAMKVEPNIVYVIPPNKDLVIREGHLRLSALTEARSVRLPIDYFLRSLAEDQGERAIGVILSGTGSDGTMGIKAVHGMGGLALIQDPESAKYDGMPRSAAGTGLADYVLPPEKMAECLVEYAKRFPAGKPGEITFVRRAPTSVHRILNLLHNHTGQDFSLYKKNTLYRRIERRMGLHQIEDAQRYVDYLQGHPEEIWSLFKELLIRVTSFFRDPEAFEALKEKILPRILENQPDGYSLRVWVPGCSTGEEAYSIAMTIREFLEENQRGVKLQIFGTDLDADSIDQARRGSFPANIATDVGPRRLKRFFSIEDKGFRIRKEIRESIIFAVQNLIKDAPFTRMDLISCRNLLIYLEPELQNKLIPLLHYSLRPEGFLFLGTAETIGGFSDLFTVANKKWKFFQSKPQIALAPEMMRAGLPWTLEGRREDSGEEKKGKEAGIAEVVRKSLLQDFSPPSVVINEKGAVLYIHGQTGKYLEPAPGQASLDILDMAREGIRYELRVGIHKVLAQGKEVAYNGLRVKGNGEYHPVNLIIKPLPQTGAAPGLMMVVFQDILPAKKGGADEKKARETPKTGRRIRELERELSHTRENLQATVEEMQSANEELKSTNEELQSTNEEMQSANEELETSKEELQSVNEELVTVNSELQAKIDMLSRAESDMNNLLNSTKIGTLFLDRNLAITRFTPETSGVMNLIPGDIGRPISHLVSNLEYNRLEADLQEVLLTLIPEEVEVKTKAGDYYLMRILPYLTLDNVIDGLVVTFTGITQLKQTAEELTRLNDLLAKARDYAQNIIETVREPLMVLDSRLRVISANHSFYRIFQVDPQETAGKFIYDLGNRQWDIPELRRLLEEILPENNSFEDFEMEHVFPSIGRKLMRLNARKITHEDGESELILLAIEDLKEKRREEEKETSDP